MKKSTIFNAMIAVKKLYARCVRAVGPPCARRERVVNTLHLLLACRRSIMGAIKTLWERRMDAVGTL